MKILIASDIHGSLPATEAILSAYRDLEADCLILLGDLLNHGPRNPIPKGYDPQGVAERLNTVSNHVIAVRGNCDSEVDQMLLRFPMMADYTWVILESGQRMFLTHGHLFNPENRPALATNDVLVHGHTHVPVAEKCDHLFTYNPGSTTFPKANFAPSYGLYESGRLKTIDFKGKVIDEICLVSNV
jgi:putative phosphoesterase